MNQRLFFRLLPLAHLVIVGNLLGGCGGNSLPEPVYGVHPSAFEGVWIEVETPPPPVQPMDVSPPPSPRHVWVDGQWNYQRTINKWTWEEGTWCLAPAGAIFYAKASVRRFRKPVGRQARWNELAKQFEEVDTGDDRWVWARGSWYIRDAAGGAVPTTDRGICIATEAD